MRRSPVPRRFGAFVVTSIAPFARKMRNPNASSVRRSARKLVVGERPQRIEHERLATVAQACSTAGN